eukprot:scaffold190018_cov18-Tisochrysis_lutea.AAC.1
MECKHSKKVAGNTLKGRGPLTSPPPKTAEVTAWRFGLLEGAPLGTLADESHSMTSSQTVNSASVMGLQGSKSAARQKKFGVEAQSKMEQHDTCSTCPWQASML